MDSVVRGICVYLFLLLVLRISGKRSVGSMTPFDFVLVLILSETVQQAMIDNDSSMTNAILLVLTLIGFDILLSVLKRKYPALAKMIDSTPALVIKEGEMVRSTMKAERVDEDDILAAARTHQGISRMDEIDYAAVEQDGNITIVPKKKE
jgi:uncharacterized membrane protein YcaP (DUF421 family)